MHNNSDYSYGKMWGSLIARDIENSIYRTLDAAISAKQEELESLTKEGCIRDDPSINEVKGVLDALKQRRDEKINRKT